MSQVQGAPVRAFTGVTASGIRWVRSVARPLPKPKEPEWIAVTQAQAAEVDKCCSGTSSTGLLPTELLLAVKAGNMECAKVKQEKAEEFAAQLTPPAMNPEVFCISSDGESEPAEDKDIRDNLGQKVLQAAKAKQTREAVQKKKAYAKAMRKNCRNKQRSQEPQNPSLWIRAKRSLPI